MRFHGQWLFGELRKLTEDRKNLKKVKINYLFLIDINIIPSKTALDGLLPNFVKFNLTFNPHMMKVIDSGPKSGTDIMAFAFGESIRLDVQSVISLCLQRSQ